MLRTRTAEKTENSVVILCRLCLFTAGSEDDEPDDIRCPEVGGVRRELGVR